MTPVCDQSREPTRADRGRLLLPRRLAPRLTPSARRNVKWVKMSRRRPGAAGSRREPSLSKVTIVKFRESHFEAPCLLGLPRPVRLRLVKRELETFKDR
jgi:hypothetical protein